MFFTFTVFSAVTIPSTATVSNFCFLVDVGEVKDVHFPEDELFVDVGDVKEDMHFPEELEASSRISISEDDVVI